jgi:hypothetical protein
MSGEVSPDEAVLTPASSLESNPESGWSHSEPPPNRRVPGLLEMELSGGGGGGSRNVDSGSLIMGGGRIF